MSKWRHGPHLDIKCGMLSCSLLSANPLGLAKCGQGPHLCLASGTGKVKGYVMEK